MYTFIKVLYKRERKRIKVPIERPRNVALLTQTNERQYLSHSPEKNPSISFKLPRQLWHNKFPPFGPPSFCYLPPPDPLHLFATCFQNPGEFL